MSELEFLSTCKEETELNLKSMTMQDLYEQECQSAVYWDLVRNAHLNKK